MIDYDLRFNKVKINDFWLSDDGTADADMCAVQFPNLHRFLAVKTGNSFKSIKRSNVTQFFSWKGEPFEIQCESLRFDIYNRVIDAINDYINTGARINMQVVTAYKTYNFIVEVPFPNPNTDQREFFGDLEGISFKFEMYSVVSVVSN